MSLPPGTAKLVRRKRKPTRAEEPDRPMRVVLGIRHQINGIAYGPGVVEVPESLARYLMENEGRNAAEERGLHERRASLIGSGNRSIPVAPDAFDDPGSLLNLPTAFTQ